MEAQLHNRRHYEEDDPREKTQHSEVIGDDHREKKSVMEKVKDQAKKIKETIKKSERDRHRDDGDEDIANPSEVHQGAVPVYESPVVPGTHLPIQTDINLEKPTDTREDRYSPNVKNEAYPFAGNQGVVPASGPVKMETHMGRSSVDPDFKNPPELPDPTSMVRISPLTGLEEDPHSPTGEISPSNYQSKVTDPTGEGGKEADVAPLLHRLDNIHIHDRSLSDQAPEPKPHSGSHDQFAPQSNPTADQLVLEPNPETLRTSDQTELDQSMPRDTAAGKLSSAVSAVVDKAVSAKDAVASKLGYRNVSSDKKHESAAERRGGGEGADTDIMEVTNMDTAEVTRETNRGVSVKEYLAEKLRPGKEDKALSDAITERFQTKNVCATCSDDMAARLGRGRKEEGDGGSARSEEGGVGRLKGAVSSWFGKRSGESESKEEIGGQQQPRIQGSGN
ncbi:hypothetical protein OROGR_022618 [Orobanche gracilis]